MLIRFRKRLLASAAARNLAVDLVREHGACALHVIDEALSKAHTTDLCCKATSNDERILVASRRHILDLVALLPERQRRPSCDGEPGEPIGRLSKRSR